LFFLLGLTNHYVMAFRGTPFVPVDFLAAGTAANVLAAYDLSFNHLAVTATLLLAVLTVVAAKLVTPKMDIAWKLATRVFFVTLTVAVVCLYFFTDVYAQVGLKPDFWNQARGYRNSGVVMNFCLNIKRKFIWTHRNCRLLPFTVLNLILALRKLTLLSFWAEMVQF
jgi:hypothetical protein